MPDPQLRLIADLLARAERSDSQAERDLALARAQREAARHGIDLAEAAYARARAGAPVEPEERSVTIGRARTPGLKTFTALFVAVCHANDIQCLIARDSTRVYAHGMASDLDVAETLYASLVVQMDVALGEWLAAGEHLRRDPRDPWGRARRSAAPAPPNLGVVRRSFREGYTARVARLLLEAKEATVRERIAESSAARGAGSVPGGRRGSAAGPQGHAAGELTSTALALREKTKSVETLHRRRMAELGARGSWTGRRDGAQLHESAAQAGWEAGGRADMRGRARRGIGR